MFAILWYSSKATPSYSSPAWMDQYDIKILAETFVYSLKFSKKKLFSKTSLPHFLFSNSAHIPWKLSFNFSPRSWWFFHYRHPLSTQLFKSFRMIGCKHGQLFGLEFPRPSQKFISMKEDLRSGLRPIIRKLLKSWVERASFFCKK